MKDAADTMTKELKLPGRPGRPRQYNSAAERQAAYRARKGTPVQVLLEPELVADLDAYLERQRANVDPDATRSSVIAKLLRSQLLRRR